MRELSTNFIDWGAKSMIVNLTWMQTFTVKMLQKFLDPVVVSRMVISNKVDEPDL